MGTAVSDVEAVRSVAVGRKEVVVEVKDEIEEVSEVELLAASELE